MAQLQGAEGASADALKGGDGRGSEIDPTNPDTVYVINDERAAVKRTLNDKLGSKIVEEKSYADYKAK